MCKGGQERGGGGPWTGTRSKARILFGEMWKVMRRCLCLEMVSAYFHRNTRCVRYLKGMWKAALRYPTYVYMTRFPR